MAKLTERTSFTKDVEGRYLCNDVSEVNAWTSAGGRPFDVIVVGGGTFGSAIAEHIWFRQKQVGGTSQPNCFSAQSQSHRPRRIKIGHNRI